MINCSLCPKRGSCCGPIPFTKEFIEKHKNKIQVKILKEYKDKLGIFLLTDDLLCVFLNRETGLCSIYEDRPEICRIYGTKIVHNHMLSCPYFKPNGNPWSEAKKKQIDRIQERDFKKLMKRFA